MLYKGNLNTAPHNWLIHHYCIKTMEENARFIKGKVLDIGCGRKPYEAIIRRYCDTYIGLDCKKTLHGFQKVEIIGSALNLPIKGESFESVISFQVMEHVPEPTRYLEEIFRIAKKSAYIIITTPFMWGEHEEPHDYYRYTRYGLRYLAEKCGFEVVSISPDTTYWVTAILRFNYWIARFAIGPLKLAILPIVWMDQFIPMMVNCFDGYTVDTATFTTVLRKPEVVRESK